MARNIRVIPLNKPGVIPATTANGRNFSRLSAYLDVADGDAAILGASGWTTVGLVGTTANRPAQSRHVRAVWPGPQVHRHHHWCCDPVGRCRLAQRPDRRGCLRG